MFFVYAHNCLFSPSENQHVPVKWTATLITSSTIYTYILFILIALHIEFALNMRTSLGEN